MTDSPPPPPFPGLAHPPTNVIDITTGSQTPDPDRTLRKVHAEQYPLQLWYFLASFIFLVFLANTIGLGLGYYRDKRRRHHHSRHASNNDHPGSSTREPQQARGSINFLRLPHALVDTFRALSFRWTIPIGRSYTLNIAEVMLTVTYMIICFTWSLINSTSTKGVKFDPHYYANIAGNVATIQFPLIVALGMKNNIISFLTGVSFDKLIYLHGMVSRVLVVLVWIHAGGRAQLGLEGKVAVTVPAIQAGVLAGVALTLLSIVSIRPIRDKAYEFFLIVHLVLAFICVLSVYFHAASLQFGQFLWPAILLWGLDRCIRLVRITLSAITRKQKVSGPGALGSSEAKGSNSPSPTTFMTAKPKLELLSAHFILLTSPPPRFFRWRAGQCVYLSFPGVSLSPLEAHPFTIATIPSSSEQQELKFFIRARSGATRRLLDHVDKDKELRVFFDGPYSSPPVLVGYDSVLLIAGGSGIAFTLPLFLDLIQRTKKSGPACRRLTFAWTVRHIDHVSWIQKELLSALQDVPDTIALNIHIFITGSAESAKVHDSLDTVEEGDDDPEALDDDTNSVLDEKVGEKDSASEAKGNSVGSNSDSGTPSSTTPTPYRRQTRNVLALPMVQVHQGRADLDRLLKDELELARDSISVNVCGTHALANAVRKSVRYPRMVDILRGGPTVSLHVEAFGSG